MPRSRHDHHTSDTPDRQAASPLRREAEPQVACNTLRKSIIEAQPDWITASYRGARKIRVGQELAQRLAKAELDAGGQPTYGATFVGVPLARVGRVAFGIGDDVAWIQLSGQLATDAIDEVIGGDAHLTRVDIATTIRLELLDDELGARAYDAACRWVEGRKHAARVELIMSSDHGSTLYLGDRKSSRYFRLYNKQRERESLDDVDGARQYARCWRAELELKHDQAEATARRVVEAPDRAAYCQATIAEYMHSHGVADVVPFDGQRALVPGFRRRSDVDSRLNYLRTHIRPIVEYLDNGGCHLEALEALGWA